METQTEGLRAPQLGVSGFKSHRRRRWARVPMAWSLKPRPFAPCHMQAGPELRILAGDCCGCCFWFNLECFYWLSLYQGPNSRPRVVRISTRRTSPQFVETTKVLYCCLFRGGGGGRQQAGGRAASGQAGKWAAGGRGCGLREGEDVGWSRKVPQTMALLGWVVPVFTMSWPFLVASACFL